MATDTGGPAFPQPAIWDEESDAVVPPGQFPYEDRLHGMTLLDHFAEQAPVLMAFWPPRDAAELAGDVRARYDWAAAMVAEKRRREGIDK